MYRGITDSLISKVAVADPLPTQGFAQQASQAYRTVPEPVVRQSAHRLTVGICETQPITVAGLRAVIGDAPDLEMVWATDSLATGLQLARNRAPNLIVFDKAFGLQTVLDAISDLRSADVPTATVVWGISVTEAEALRFLQSGARGIVRKTTDLHTLLGCLRTVGAGSSWMEDYVLRDTFRPHRNSRSDLTSREQQVLELVEQGLKNKEIANELGIRPGTVKIHLKHIFEKTGVRGRYGLALASLRERGALIATESA